MKKRVLAIMLACLMLVSLLPLGALAEEVEHVTCPGEGKEHYKDTNCKNYTWIEDVEGKCGAYDYTVYQCNECNDYFAADFVPVDHVWEDVEASDPTCTEPGNKAGKKCSVCGEIEDGNEIPALGHTWELTEVTDNCEKAVYTCSVCGETKTEENDGHVYTKIPVIVVEPTATEDGLALYTCTVCGHEKFVRVLCHECDDEWELNPGYAAECGKTGLKAHYACKYEGCGKLYDLNGKETTLAKLTIPAEKHGVAGEIVVTKKDVVNCEAFLRQNWVCPADGEYTFSTNNANYVYMYNAGAWMGPGSFNARQSLTVTLNAGESFDFYSWDDCAVTVTFTTKVVGPIVTIGDCTNKIPTIYTYCCEKCGEVYDVEGELPHVWQLQHSTEPTCTTFGFDVYACDLCGELKTTVKDPNGHTAVKAYTVNPDCLNEGFTHYYCSVCGYEWDADVVDALGHDYKVTHHIATCIQYAYTEYECKVCGDYYVEWDYEGGLNKGEHDPSVLWYGTINPATCTEDGDMVIYCMHCNVYATKILPATGHDMKDPVVVKPTCSQAGYTITSCKNCNYYEISNPQPKYELQSEYTWEEAEKIHANNRGECVLEYIDTYRPGNCEIIGLERYYCHECRMFILVVDETTGHHVQYTDLPAYDPNWTAPVPADGTIIGGSGTWDTSDPFVLSNLPITLTLGYGEDHCYKWVATADTTVNIEFLSGSAYMYVGAGLQNFYGNSLFVAAGETMYLEFWAMRGCTVRLSTFIPEQEFAAQAPTCEANGWTEQYYCDRCDAFIASETYEPAVLDQNGEILVPEKHPELKALGHNWGDPIVEGKPATCTQDGVSAKYKCVNCGATKGGDVLPATGHNYQWIDGEVKEDRFSYLWTANGKLGIKIVTQFGYNHYGCPNCGDEYISDYEPLDCYHEYEEDMFSYINPTCHELGKIAYRCQLCDKVEYVTDMNSEYTHWNMAGEILIDSCLNADVTDRACVYCCYQLNADGSFAKDNDGNYIIIDEIGTTHNDITVTYVPATCNDYAYEITFCGDCGWRDVKKIDEPLADHIYGAWAPVYNNDKVIVAMSRVCTVCGHVDEVEYESIAFTAEFENEAVTDGSEVKVIVSVAGLEDSLWGFKLNIGYSANLTFVGAEAVSDTFNYAADAHDNGGYVTIVANAEGNVELNAKEAVFELTFKVDSRYISEIRVWFTTGEILNIGGERVEAYGFGDVMNTVELMDLDLDGDVTLADALAVYNIITGAVEATAEEIVAADLDKDGEVTLADFLNLYKYLTGEYVYSDILALGEPDAE